MRNRILNITATGTYVPIPNVPMKCQAITIQARTSDDVYYHFAGDTANYYTIKADTEKTLVGKFDTGDIWIMAAADVVIEVELTPGGFSM